LNSGAGGGGGGGGGGAAISCAGYNKTTVLTFPYSGRGQQTQITGGQGPNEIVIGTFTTPATVGIPTIGVAVQTGTGLRANLSTTPCDLTASQFDYYTLGLSAAVQPNTTYYINVLAVDPIWFSFTPR
jgi:hypothetical protein